MDDADITSQRAELPLQAAIRRASKDIPPGVPGPCDLCGEHSQRLIDGTCAPCRDRYKPTNR